MVAENFKDWLKLNYQTENTIRDIESYMNHFFSLFSEYTQDNVNAYLTKRLDEGVKKSTFNKLIYVLGVYAKFLKMEVEFPKTKTPDQRIKDYMTLGELEQQVLPMIDLIFSDYETYDLLIRFLFFTGLRVEEVISLEKKNIDFEKGIIRVVNTKGKVDREVPFLDEKLQKDLEKYSNRMAQEKLFDFSYYQIWYNLKKLTKDIQWTKKIHPHFFRISFAQYCLSLNMNPIIIQQLLGHKDMNTTLIYCKPNDKVIKEVCNQYKRKG